MGGTNDKDNLVDLTAREHFLIHKLLCEIYPNEYKLFHAFRMMAVMKNSKDNKRIYYVSSHEYTRIKLQHKNIMQMHNKNKIVSIETKDKISKSCRGKKKRPMSEETKKKISAALKGRKLTSEHKEKVRIANTNNPKCTGKATTLEKELERREKIKKSWIMRKENKSGGIND